MTASPESLFPSGGDLDSSQLHMEPDELDTLREGEDPGIPEDDPQGEEEKGIETSWGLHSYTFFPPS